MKTEALHAESSFSGKSTSSTPAEITVASGQNLGSGAVVGKITASGSDTSPSFCPDNRSMYGARPIWPRRAERSRKYLGSHVWTVGVNTAKNDSILS